MTPHMEDLREYSANGVLSDGGSVLLRAVRSTDKPQIKSLFQRLSPDSIHARWFTSKRVLTDEELRRLTELDFVNDVALAAVLPEEVEERFVGVGRYYRTRHRRAAVASAEVAFVVADEHQGRGIGTLLLEHLAAIARASGIEELEAEVLADNAKMLDVFARCGFAVRRSLDAGVYHVVFPTNATAPFLRASLARERHAETERSASSPVPSR